MPVSVRVRFEVFKRDNFQCRYCGRISPTVVLEIDHVVPAREGGSDDPINLVTSCWECNRGKSDVPLSQVIVGEDPHDRAVCLLEQEYQLLEQERQMREYNAVVAVVERRVKKDLGQLVRYWNRRVRLSQLSPPEIKGIENALHSYPPETIRQAMSIAISHRKTRSLAYVHACLHNWSPDKIGKRIPAYQV